MSVFKLSMMPAREGDCLLLEYGHDSVERRILVDGGRAGTWKDVKAKHILPRDKVIDLLIITHVDRDHIEGALSLLTDAARPTIGEIWFNGFEHLHGRSVSTEELGAVMGEGVTDAIVEQELSWNASFSGRPICVVGKPQASRLSAGLVATVLSPDARKLRALVPKWKVECAKAGITPGITAADDDDSGLEPLGGISVAAIKKLADSKFKDDKALPNGTSIAMLVEFQGRRILLGADAHVGRLVRSLRALGFTSKKRLKLDAFKISHHGSKSNCSKQLLSLIDCPRYLISTNGSHFAHPDPETISRLIVYGGDRPELIFNYRSEQTEIWEDEQLQSKLGYTTRYPKHDGWLSIDL